MTDQLRRRELDCACTRTGSTPPGATLAGVVLRLGDHGLDRRGLAAPCPARRRAKRAMPAVRNAKSALSWRYPTRTPARVRITSTPTAGRATAASAASETATGRSGRAGGRNDRTPIGMAPLDAGGAIPGSDVVAPKVVRPSVATPVFLLLSGLPGRCCSVGSCGCGGGVTIAAGLPATGTWLHPGDPVDATAVRPFFLVSAATTLVTGAAAVGAGAAAVGAGAAT